MYGTPRVTRRISLVSHSSRRFPPVICTHNLSLNVLYRAFKFHVDWQRFKIRHFMCIHCISPPARHSSAPPRLPTTRTCSKIYTSTMYLYTYNTEGFWSGRSNRSERDAMCTAVGDFQGHEESNLQNSLVPPFPARKLFS